jgi:hypothetical protein
LGSGYFVTVKHAVVALKGDDNPDSKRKIVSIKIFSTVADAHRWLGLE